MLIVELILLYLFLVFFVTRLIVPHLGFKKEVIPATIPDNIQTKITELSRMAKTDAEFLNLVYEFVTTTYRGSRLKTLTQFWRAFGDMYNKQPGFLPCTGQNFLVRTFLVKSDRFSEADIQVVTTFHNFFIHQYLKVKVNNEWVAVDPWSHFLGVPLGKKSAFFG
jgi:hypothetical protein